MGGVPSRHRWRKGPRRLPAALLRAGLGILPLAALSGGEAVYTSESHGFRLERPDPAWVFQEKRDGPAGTLALILAPAGGGGLAQVSVRARPLAGETTAEALRDETLASIAGDDAYTLRSRETFTLDGHEAKGFVLDARSAGTTFRVRQCDLVAQGVRYTIECHAPRGHLDEYVRTSDVSWRTFRILPPHVAGQLRPRRAKSGVTWPDDVRLAGALASEVLGVVVGGVPPNNGVATVPVWLAMVRSLPGSPVTVSNAGDVPATDALTPSLALIRAASSSRVLN